MTPTAFRASVELAHAVRLLRRVEAHHDQQGWHSHANMHVYVVYDHHDVVTGAIIERVMRGSGEPVRNSRYSAQPMLPSRMFAAAWEASGIKAPAALYRFAFNTAYADTGAIRSNGDGDDAEHADGLEVFRELLRMPGILGYIVCSEAHLLEGDLANQAHRSGTPFALVPGSVEVRAAYMVDVDNRVSVVHRNRGETAEVLPDCDLGGRVINSLRMMMDLSLGRLPQDQAGFDARYPCVERPL